jgi:hypothetical protein
MHEASSAHGLVERRRISPPPRIRHAFRCATATATSDSVPSIRQKRLDSRRPAETVRLTKPANVVSRPTDHQGLVLPDCQLTTHSPAETVSWAFIYNRAALTPRHVRWPKPTFATRNSGRADSNLRSPRPRTTVHLGPKPSAH